MAKPRSFLLNLRDGNDVRVLETAAVVDAPPAFAGAGRRFVCIPARSVVGAGHPAQEQPAPARPDGIEGCP